jgi:Ser/Thr protein kinase RdoA (MazF antagonist)
MNGPEVQIEAEYLDAARRAMEHFPVAAALIEPVMHSENVTFRVTDRDGGRSYVLRLHRPGYNSIEELESERVWVQALKETGVPVPDSVVTRQGGHFTRVDIPGRDEQRFAGMTTWLEGEPLSNFLTSCTDPSERKRMFFRIGEIAAMFHNQSAEWQAPPGFTRRELNHESLLGEAPFWGRFWEHPDLDASERALLLRQRDKLRASLGAYGKRADTFGLIHADLTLDNILFDGDRLAVIDFDDCAYGWYLYDITALLIECVLQSDIGELQEALFEGYRRRRSLTQQDIDRFSDFLLVRGMALIGWFYQRPEQPGLEYFRSVKNWVVDACASR